MMGLHQIFQRIRDVIHPPTDDELQTRYASLVGQAQRWAAKGCCYFTPEQMKEELLPCISLDLDQMEVDLPARITLGPISGAVGAGFFEDFLGGGEDRQTEEHFLIQKIVVPVSDVGVLLTYPDSVLVTPDRDGNVILFKKTRDLHDFDPEAFRRLEDLAHELRDPSYPDEWPENKEEKGFGLEK